MQGGCCWQWWGQNLLVTIVLVDAAPQVENHPVTIISNHAWLSLKSFGTLGTLLPRSIYQSRKWSRLMTPYSIRGIYDPKSLCAPFDHARNLEVTNPFDIAEQQHMFAYKVKLPTWCTSRMILGGSLGNHWTQASQVFPNGNCQCMTGWRGLLAFKLIKAFA